MYRLLGVPVVEEVSLKSFGAYPSSHQKHRWVVVLDDLFNQILIKRRKDIYMHNPHVRFFESITTNDTNAWESLNISTLGLDE